MLTMAMCCRGAELKRHLYTYRHILLMLQYAICYIKHEVESECTTVLISWIYTCEIQWEEVTDPILFIYLAEYHTFPTTRS